MDSFKNFAKSTLASGITSGATSLTVATGTGARFPAVPFNASIWDTSIPDPSDDANAEVVRVTAIATDTFTITRGQEGTTGVAHNTGGKTYGIVATLTKKTTDEIAARLPRVVVLAAQINVLDDHDGDLTVSNALSVDVVAGETLVFEAHLYTIPPATNVVGPAFKMSGTCTSSLFIQTAVGYWGDATGLNSTQIQPGDIAGGLDRDVLAVDPTYAVTYIRSCGSLVVSGSGTLILKFTGYRTGSHTNETVSLRAGSSLQVQRT